MLIKIHTDWLTVGQFLKLIGAIDTGGQAKDYLKNETVLVNGCRTISRGKKLYPGDTIKIAKIQYLIAGE